MARYVGYSPMDEQLQVAETFQHQTARARPTALKTMAFVEPADAPPGLRRDSAGNWLDTSSRRVGWVPFSVGQDLLFERIWVIPQEVDAGFITEELSYDIAIWNAYQESSAEFTALNSVSPDGTTLTPPAFPYTLTPGNELILTLTIDADGPASQSTTYTAIVNALSFDIDVTGLRVIDLASAPEPNWQKGIMVRYRFETAIFTSQRFVEQRRPLMDKPYRHMTLNYLMSDTDSHKFFYMLSYGHDKVFGVPIYNEQMRCTVIPTGGTTITTSTATTSMYNLNNLSTHIAIVDHSAGTSEIKEVDSIAANSIVVTQNISGTFDVDTTLVYPVVFVTVSAANKSHETDDVETLTIDYEEYNNG